MKAKIIIALVAITGTFGLPGCKPKPATLAGQVFIVTQGGDSVKLGDVSILLIEKSQVTDFWKTKGPIIDAEIASLKQEFAVAKDAVSLDWGNTARAENDRLRVAVIKLKNSQAAENYFVDFFPLATQTTHSDADGKFSFVYPRDKPFTIYASANRRTLKGFENYYWLINAPTNAEMLQVFLSNNNLVYVDPDGYFKLKPEEAISDEVAYNRVVYQIRREKNPDDWVFHTHDK
jgi:hypothetical protein